jgi:hypothetical protein
LACGLAVLQAAHASAIGAVIGISAVGAVIGIDVSSAKVHNHDALTCLALVHHSTTHSSNGF